ncbi:MAG: hypothetical protein COX14_01210 [Chloroflexi bacterium CG23_combo_of_CG06-09_8_20_14_all_45_10]|nr:MAG: hypothetical protein COX14_01210 [Chloroflexi bacterium CG23_combo_of_CG06-09_8_20_14_all_45_10]
MKKGVALIAVLVLLSLLVSGCGGGSPSDAVKAFYKAGNEGNYAKAKSYLSIHTQMAMEMWPLGMPSFEEQMDAATKEGTIARIDIKGGEEYGYMAILYLTLHYRDGSQEKDTVQLKKEDGKWKIYMSSLLMIASYKELWPKS